MLVIKIYDVEEEEIDYCYAQVQSEIDRTYMQDVLQG